MPYEVPAVPGLRLHARYRPADEPERVGGDWYDALPLSDGRVFIVVGDVTGHGLKAIEFMTRLRRKVIGAALHESDPGAILTEANRQLLRTTGHEHVIGTAVCAFIDPATCEVQYATGGHPAPIFVQPGASARLLPSTGLILGVQDHVYRTHVAHATDNTLVVFYTDGLIEFTRDLIAGEAKLLAIAQDVAFTDEENPALAITRRTLGSAAPHDDVAILTVTFECGAVRTQRDRGPAFDHIGPSPEQPSSREVPAQRHPRGGPEAA